MLHKNLLSLLNCIMFLLMLPIFFPVHTYRIPKLWIVNTFQLLWLCIFCSIFLLKPKFKEFITSHFCFALLCTMGKNIQIFPIYFPFLQFREGVLMSSLLWLGFTYKATPFPFPPELLSIRWLRLEGVV